MAGNTPPTTTTATPSTLLELNLRLPLMNTKYLEKVEPPNGEKQASPAAAVRYRHALPAARILQDACPPPPPEHCHVGSGMIRVCRAAVTQRARERRKLLITSEVAERNFCPRLPLMLKTAPLLREGCVGGGGVSLRACVRARVSSGEKGRRDSSEGNSWWVGSRQIHLG